MNKETKLVSVIVPVFMVEPYLDCCIQSIVNQTYQNLEIILIDDGSKDECPKICDKWAEKDSRIIVIHKGNSGVSSARNAGIEKATGRYLVFVDGDDFLEPLYVEYLYRTICDTEADISECRYIRYPDISETKAVQAAMSQPRIQTAEEALRIWSRPEQGDFNLVVWNKMYCRELVREVLFAEGFNGGEDVLFTCYVFGKSKKIARIDNELYHWRNTPDSLSKRFPDNTLQTIQLYFSALDYLKKDYPSIATECKIWMCHLMNGFLYCLQYESNLEYKQQAKEKMLSFRRRIHFTVKEWLQCHMKDKVGILCSNVSFVGYYVRFRHFLYMIHVF